MSRNIQHVECHVDAGNSNAIAFAERVRATWNCFACGTEDRLITMNRNFRQWLQSKSIPHADIETPGMHTWMVWRRNLSEFAPLLFR